MNELYRDEQRGLAIPVALIVAGLLLFVMNLTIGYAVLIRPSMGGVGFESPGSLVVDAEATGDWTVMHQTAGKFNGQRHKAEARDARGLSITVTRVADGAAVEFEADDSFSMMVGATQRVTVGRFIADEAGQYRVDATGNASPIVLYVTRWSKNAPLALVGTIGGVQIVAVVLGFFGVNRLIKHRRARSAVGRVPA